MKMRVGVVRKMEEGKEKNDGVKEAKLLKKK